jgi:hypothetical protein
MWGKPAVLDWIGKLLNRINDWDLTWVGFRALRPAQNQNMSARVVAALCLVYAPLSAVVAFVVCLLWVRVVVPRYSVRVQYPEQFPWLMAGAAAMAFILLQTLLACAWNRRAARLRADAQHNSAAS